MPHIQATTATAAGPISTVAPAFGAAVGSGAIVIGAVSWDQASAATISSVQDNKGNNYTVYDFTTDAPNGQGGSSFILGNITNGPTTVTITFSVNTDQIVVVMDEYSGGALLADPRDGHTSNAQLAGGPGTGTDAIVSTNITTTADGDTIWGAAFQTSLTGGTISSGTGYNQRAQIAANASFIAITSEDKVQTAHGAVQTTFTQLQASNTICFVTALKSGPPFVQNNWPVPQLTPRPIVQQVAPPNLVNQQTNQQTSPGIITGSQCL